MVKEEGLLVQSFLTQQTPLCRHGMFLSAQGQSWARLWVVQRAARLADDDKASAMAEAPTSCFWKTPYCENGAVSASSHVGRLWRTA